MRYEILKECCPYATHLFDDLATFPGGPRKVNPGFFMVLVFMRNAGHRVRRASIGIFGSRLRRARASNASPRSIRVSMQVRGSEDPAEAELGEFKRL